MEQMMQYGKIEESCGNLTNIASEMETTISQLKGIVSSLSGNSWIGPASQSFIEETNSFVEQFNGAKETLAMSVLFLHGCSDRYQDIDYATRNSLINLVGGQAAIDAIDVSTLPSARLKTVTEHQSFDKRIGSPVEDEISPTEEMSSEMPTAGSGQTGRSGSGGSPSQGGYASGWQQTSGNAGGGYPTIPTLDSSYLEEENNDLEASADLESMNIEDYPTGDSEEDGLARATLVAKYLSKNGGFSAVQAAALAGVYLDENNCNPNSSMQAEKSSENDNNYGAGIASWTSEDVKQKALKAAGLPENTRIEDLTLDEQCDMIIAESRNHNKTYYDALKRCDTLEDASATAVVMTGGVGFSENWETHPTVEEANNLANYYGQANDNAFGKSDYHWNLDKRRLENARKIYELISDEGSDI